MPLTTSLLLALLAVLILFCAARYARRRPLILRRAFHPPEKTHGFIPRKPEWVRKEVVRLKALMPHASCRTVAATFKSLHEKKGETVGKTYVAMVFKRHGCEILKVRKKIKNRPLQQGPRGLTYAIDLTFVHPEAPPVLAVLDHGTRALLALRELRVRTTIGVLRALFEVFETFGTPRFLRSDNERIFTSPTMTLALLFLGVRPQRIDPYCPWQNGRVERVFRTLKERLYAFWEAAGRPDAVQGDLDVLRTWYNHARPHQSLAGLTPAMAWAGVTASRKTPWFFEEWNGILAGFVVPT